LSGSITGAGRSTGSLSCHRELDLDSVRVGSGGRHDHVGGLDQRADPLVLDLGVDLVAVGVGIAVNLVKTRMIGFWAPRSRLNASISTRCMSLETTNRIRSACRATSPRQGLANLAANLVDPRGIDQDELGPFEAGAVQSRLLPALLRAHGSCAVGCADLEDLLSQQGVEDRRLARLTMPKAAISIVFWSSFSVKGAKLLELVAQGILFLGGEVGGSENVSSRLSRAFSTTSGSEAAC